MWLVDKDHANLDAARVIADAAPAVRNLRAEGRTVLLHCVHAQSRTPVVAAAYGALITGDKLQRHSGEWPRNCRPSILGRPWSPRSRNDVMSGAGRYLVADSVGGHRYT